MTMTISGLADQVGVSPDTLRYYERLGLIPAPPRTAAGYRIYDEEMAERLRFVKTTQRMGLHLADIKDLLDIKDRGACPCGHTDTIVERRLAEVETELARLRSVRRQLVTLRDRNRQCADPTGDSWWCSTASTVKGGDDR
jgi:MerR family mercuric resistance operon transcriptional regulator